ncbi:uncharacterized protein O3C94_014397 [Discoglossus pictus]
MLDFELCGSCAYLVEIKPCTSQSARVCECRPGLYCATKTENTCARCKEHKKCEPGYGVRIRGTSQINTVCERCPQGQYSDVYSATEGCKPHTDCAKFQLYSVSKGSSTKNEVCQPLSIYPTPTKALGESYPWTLVHSTKVRGPVTKTVSPPKSATSTETPVLVTKIIENTLDKDKWRLVYVAAGIICVTIPIVSFTLMCKRKMCKIKALVSKRRISQWRVTPEQIKYQEDSKECDLLQRLNMNPPQEMTSEPYGRVEPGILEKERLIEAELVNTRIDNIYIMNADTVLVGSISEVANRQSPVLPISESHSVDCAEDKAEINTRYPEQESSKVPVNDLMFSVEEESKQNLSGKDDTEY